MLAGAITYGLCSLIITGGVIGFIINLAICLTTSNIVLFACLFWMSEFKESFKILKSISSMLLNKQKATGNGAEQSSGTPVQVTDVDVNLDGSPDFEVVETRIDADNNVVRTDDTQGE